MQLITYLDFVLEELVNPVATRSKRLGAYAMVSHITILRLTPTQLPPTD